MRASLQRAEKTTPVVMPSRSIKANRESPMTLDLRKRGHGAWRSTASCQTTQSRNPKSRSTITRPQQPVPNICASGNCQQRYTVPNPKRFGRTLKSYSAVTLCIQAGALAGSLAGAACAVMLSNNTFNAVFVCVGFVFDLPQQGRRKERPAGDLIVRSSFCFYYIVRFLNSGTPVPPVLGRIITKSI